MAPVLPASLGLPGTHLAAGPKACPPDSTHSWWWLGDGSGFSLGFTTWYTFWWFLVCVQWYVHESMLTCVCVLVVAACHMIKWSKMVKASNIAIPGCQSRARPLGLEWPKHVSKEKLCATIKDGYMPATSGSTTSINLLGDIMGGSQTWEFQILAGLSPWFHQKKCNLQVPTSRNTKNSLLAAISGFSGSSFQNHLTWELRLVIEYWLSWNTTKIVVFQPSRTRNLWGPKCPQKTNVWPLVMYPYHTHMMVTLW